MKTVPLGELVDFYSGGTPSKSNPDFWGGDVPWFSAKDMKRSRLIDSVDHISERVFRETSLRCLPTGTIAMVVRGMILAHTVPISILDVDAAINQDLKALIPKRPIHVGFLAAMLRAQHASILSQVSTAAHGTKKLESRVLQELPIPDVPPDEQRRIATILDHADAIRTKRRQILTHLDTLTQSIFHDMFGQSRADSAPLAEVAEIWDCLHSTPKWADDGEICLRTPNLIRGGWNWDDTRYVDEVQFAKRSKGGGAEPGDIILSREGTVGIAAIVESGMRVCMGQRLVQVRPNQGVVRPDYLLEFLLTALDPARIAHVMVGSTAQHLNVKDLRGLMVPIVSLDEQHQFATQKSAVDRRRNIVQRALAADIELFASLQSRAFRGEL